MSPHSSRLASREHAVLFAHTNELSSQSLHVRHGCNLAAGQAASFKAFKRLQTLCQGSVLCCCVLCSAPKLKAHALVHCRIIQTLENHLKLQLPLLSAPVLL